MFIVRERESSWKTRLRTPRELPISKSYDRHKFSFVFFKGKFMLHYVPIKSLAKKRLCEKKKSHKMTSYAPKKRMVYMSSMVMHFCQKKFGFSSKRRDFKVFFFFAFIFRQGERFSKKKKDEKKKERKKLNQINVPEIF